ncbi:hypothetical protein JCM6882_003457 [Rhodosporidiobolus microsporus]
MDDHYAALQAIKNQTNARENPDLSLFLAAIGQTNNRRVAEKARGLHHNQQYGNYNGGYWANDEDTYYDRLAEQIRAEKDMMGYCSDDDAPEDEDKDEDEDDTDPWGAGGLSDASAYCDSELADSQDEEEELSSPAEERIIFPILNLPVETQQHILSFLSCSDLASTARLSRAFPPLVRKLLYKRITVLVYVPWERELLPPSSERLIRTLNSSSEIRALVKHLSLEWQAVELHDLYRAWKVDEETQHEAGPYGDEWADDFEADEAIDSVDVLRPVLTSLAAQLGSVEISPLGLRKDPSAKLLRGLTFPLVRSLSVGTTSPSIFRSFPALDSFSGHLVPLTPSALAKRAPKLRGVTIRTSGFDEQDLSSSARQAQAFAWLTSRSYDRITSLTVPLHPPVTPSFILFTSLTSITFSVDGSGAETHPTSFPPLPRSVTHLSLSAPSSSNPFASHPDPQRLLASLPHSVKRLTVPLHLFRPEDLTYLLRLSPSRLDTVELALPRSACDLIHSGWNETSLAAFARQCREGGVELQPERGRIEKVVQDSFRAWLAVVTGDHQTLAKFL